MSVAGADTPAEFAQGSPTVQAQQDSAEIQGKHPAEVPGTLRRDDASAEAGVAGPALQLNNFDVDAGIWQGSVLYLTKQDTQSPMLQLQTVVSLSLCLPVLLPRVWQEWPSFMSAGSDYTDSELYKANTATSLTTRVALKLLHHSCCAFAKQTCLLATLKQKFQRTHAESSLLRCTVTVLA